MKNFYLTICCFLWFSSFFAQIGIGTTSPDNSSALDVASNNTGILIPRVSLVNVLDAVNPISTPATSLLVYNTNALVTGGTGAGYYYWNGSQWTKLFASTDDKWTRSASGYMYPTTLSDNIGINTTNPTSKLDVNGQITIDQKNFGGYGGLLIKGNQPGSNYPNIAFSILNSSGTDAIAGYIGGNINSNISGFEAMDLAFMTSQNGLSGLTERMRIKDNGFIGIGNTNPAFILDLSNRMRIRSGGLSNTAGMWLNNSSNTIGSAFIGMDQFENVGFYGNTGAGWGLVMKTNNGNIGIGNQNPNAPLQFSNSIANRKIVLYDANNDDNQYYGFGINGSTLRYQTDALGADHVFFAGINATTSSELFRIKGTGNVGIGITNPLEKLHVNGNIRSSTLAGVGNRIVTSDANGTMAAVGAGTNGQVITQTASGPAWQSIGISNISVSLTTGGVNVPYNTGIFLQTGASITLPTGKYAVNVTMLLTNTTGTITPANSSFWLRTSFSDSNGPNPLPSTDILGAPLISGNLTGSSLYSILNGTVIINNTSGGFKTYYYVAGRVQPYNTTESVLSIGGNLGENNIIAYKLQ